MTGERRAPGPVESLDGTVVSLADVGAGDRSIAGGKGANLGELVRAGFPVPPGFVITTVAYGLMLEKSGLAQTLVDLLQEDAEGEKIRAAFSGVAMPAGVPTRSRPPTGAWDPVRLPSVPAPLPRTSPEPHSPGSKTPS